jgi:hypothetical protein
MTVCNGLGRGLPFAFLSLIALSLLWQTTQAQEAAKTLEWGEHANYNCRKSRALDSKISYDIEQDDILINGRSVLVGEPFVGDVRELVFVVKNVSDRPFAFIQVTVILPEVKIPPQVPFVRSVESKAQPVKPGEQAELRMPRGKIYDWVKDSVTSQGRELSTIKRAAIDGFIVGQIGQGTGVCAAARDPRNQPPPR